MSVSTFFGDSAFKITIKKIVHTLIQMMLLGSFKSLSIPWLLFDILKYFVKLTSFRISTLLSVFNYFTTKAQKEQNGGNRSALSFGVISTVIFIGRFLKEKTIRWVEKITRR